MNEQLDRAGLPSGVEVPRVQRGLMSAVGFCCLLGVGFLLGPVSSDATEEKKSFRTYSSSVAGWSVSYPADWTVTEKSPSFVLFGFPAAMCGVHTRRVPFESADALAETMLPDMARRLAETKGLKTELVSRERIELSNDVEGVDVVVNLVQGGRSRRVFTVLDGVA